MVRYSFIVMDLHHLSPAGLPALSVVQWLAYAIPYRRFADTLADADARLGANVDRYSFIAVDSHHLLLASLLAHAAIGTPSSQADRPKCYGKPTLAARSAVQKAHRKKKPHTLGILARSSKAPENPMRWPHHPCH